jgi:outer membrane protein TolC
MNSVMLFRLLLLLPLLQVGVVAAVEPLPEPLTLEYALSLTDTMHPDLLLQRSARLRSDAELQSAEADTAASLTIEGRARWVQPPDVAPSSDVTDDHKLSLLLRKPLYDFGQSSSRYQAALQDNISSEQRYQALLLQRRVTIMRAFFDVLLADMEYARDNEALATAFIAFDRLRTRQELGQASDIAVAELESGYQQARLQLNLSETRQRATRARLANVLGHPGMLSSNLTKPTLDYDKRKLPEYEKLLKRAMNASPLLKALQAQLTAAQQRLEAARAGDMPRLDAELEASDYSRDLGSSDHWRAGINLSVPLYTGGRVDAVAAQQQSEVYRIQALLEQAKYDLRQQVLDMWLELQTLKLRRERASKQQDYRELYLDQSRANYEMEFKSDLGDAMVRLSEAQLALAKNNFDFAIAWEQLAALVGGPINDVTVNTPPAENPQRSE